MKIEATVTSALHQHDVSVSTNGSVKGMSIAVKPEGKGSVINGGELLFLSLATCFCNDIYREAAKRKMQIDFVNVTVTGYFGTEGEPASQIHYSADVRSGSASKEEITALMDYVDNIAEVHRTLRQGVSVELIKNK